MEENAEITVDEILNEQREESEARAILNDLEKLNIMGVEQKNKWIWELIQNAKDVADKEAGINLFFELTKEKLIFKHHGNPFSVKELLAITRKTSTKSLNNEEGTTGKFGSGFVSTHVLNKIVVIKGILINSSGSRRFELALNRSFETLETLMEELKKTYEKIDKIDKTNPDNIQDFFTSYEYELNDYTLIPAKNGLEQLKKNIAFTLLINKVIKSITIKTENSEYYYRLGNEEEGISDIVFIKVISNDPEINPNHGLLFLKQDGLILSLPTIKHDESWEICKVDDNAKIFKEFPLVGTEAFYSPILIQSDQFQPTETRDGIRTKKVIEEDPNRVADENRRILKDANELKKVFFKFIYNCNNIKNIHLFAETGLPGGNENYLGKDWYKKEIQTGFREFLKDYNIVRTVNGQFIKISEAIFIKSIDKHFDDFYSLVSRFYPNYCPDKDSNQNWIKIIEKDKDNWPQVISISVEDLINRASEIINVSSFEMTQEDAFKWLNDLIQLIFNIKESDLGEKYQIYPNQLGLLCSRSKVRLEKGLPKNMKDISFGMERNLENELLDSRILNNDLIQDFDIKQFYDMLNIEIGNLLIIQAKDKTEKIESIFKIACIFKDTKAPKREDWFELIHELLPVFAGEKIVDLSIDDFKFEPAEKWTLKYIADLIQTTENIDTFSKNYFSEDKQKAFAWLDRYVDFVYRNDEYKETVSKYSIIPVQSGTFKSYDETLFREKLEDNFDDIIKKLYNEHIKPHTYDFLIDTKITCEKLRQTGIELITRTIDNLFLDPESENKVKNSGDYHDLFHELNDWFEKRGSDASALLPIFSEKRPILHIKAFGEGKSKDIMRFLKINKTIDDLEELAKLKLSTGDLKKLEVAAELLGGAQKLLDHAQRYIEDSEEIIWRKRIGRAAEEAFREAIKEVEPKFDLENPDYGKDYTIKLKGVEKEYFVEVKSTVNERDSVRMSKLQGDTAKSAPDSYALTVVTRPSGLDVTKDYFIKNSRFVVNIGKSLADKLDEMRNGLSKIAEHEMDDISVNLDSKEYSISVRKKVWEEEDSIGFSAFVDHLRTYFDLK